VTTGLESWLSPEIARSVLEVSGAATALFDLDGRFLFVNDAMCDLTGYTRSELYGEHFTKLTHPDDAPQQRRDALDLLTGKRKSYQAHRRYVHASGAILWVVVSGAIVQNAAGKPENLLAQVHDVTPLRVAEEQARMAEAVFRSAFDHAPIGMGLVGLDGRWLQVNEALSRILGYPLDRLVGMNVLQLTDPRDAESDRVAIAELASGERQAFCSEQRYRHADGHLVWVRLSSTAVTDEDGRPSFFVCQYEDVSDRKLADQRLAHLALHDPLTGLANRTLLLDRLGLALAQRSREGGVVIVAFGDLDGFKSVNDRFGHAAGDQVLCEVADLLRSMVRAGDTVARLGGDEFVVVTTVHTEEEATTFSKRLREAVAQGKFGGTFGPDSIVGMSLGLAMCPRHGTSARYLLAAADAAMYAEKSRRKRG
jgi:diguanylate cyclase (GGDEF)-like protein/PAS domain S-box-containing protein